jgi:hypothetical protein
MAARDTQIGGEHYTSLMIQPWEALEVWMSREQFEGYLLGTAINYLARSDHKADRLEDWKKARHTLDRLIELGESERRL